MLTPSTPSIDNNARASATAASIPACTGSAAPKICSVTAWSSSRPGRPCSTAADALSVNTATAAITGIDKPANRADFTKSGDHVRERHVVEYRQAGAGTLLLHQARRPCGYGRGGGRLRHRRNDSHRRCQRDQPRTVEVEGLRHVRTHVVAATVTCHAHNRLDPDAAQSAQFLLEHHAVAVPARQRDPRRHTRVEQQTTHQRRREVGLVLMLADEHRVT